MGRAAGTKKLTFIAPGGSVQDGFTNLILPPFETATGIKVTYISGTAPQNLARIASQRSAPEVDVYWGSDIYRIQGTKQGVFAALDKSRLPNLRNISDQYRLDDGYGIPVSVLAAGVAYNTKVFSDRGWAPPTSFADFWDPKHKGHVGLQALPQGIPVIMLVGIAKQYGGSESNMAPGFARFEELRPNLFGVFSSGPQLDQARAQGNVWISVSGASIIKLAKEQGEPVEFVKPKEGLVALQNQLMIVKGAPNADAAYAFANYMLSVPVQSKLPQAISYGPVASDAELSPAARPYNALKEDKIIPVDWSIAAEKLADWTEEWQRRVERK